SKVDCRPGFRRGIWWSSTVNGGWSIDKQASSAPPTPPYPPLAPTVSQSSRALDDRRRPLDPCLRLPVRHRGSDGLRKQHHALGSRAPVGLQRLGGEIPVLGIDERAQLERLRIASRTDQQGTKLGDLAREHVGIVGERTPPVVGSHEPGIHLRAMASEEY